MLCLVVLCFVLFVAASFPKGEKVIMRPMSQISVRLRAVLLANALTCLDVSMLRFEIKFPHAVDQLFINVDKLLWVEPIEFTKMSAAQQWDTRVSKIVHPFARAGGPRNACREILKFA